jgi:uncharacterized protein (DUF2141 family)
MKKILLTLFLITGPAIMMSQDSMDNTIEIEITNIESDKGQMRIGLYDSEESWLNNAHSALVAPITDGRVNVTFKNVPNGIYAVSSFHDENDNGELDTNFLGIPKEDTGSSNNAPARMGPPKWADAKFEIKGKSIKLSIKL